MENNTLTLDELNKLPKNAIALLYMQMSESFALLSEQNKTIQKQNELLIKQNLKDIEVEIIQHDCTQEDLQAHFPKGWHVLEDEVYKELQYIPSCFKVLEHHVKVYAGNHDSGNFLRAKAPNRLLSHSILTPELAAAVFNAKYVNAM